MSTVAVVGMGSVGSSIVYAMMIQGVASRYILIDSDAAKLRAQALDLQHGQLFAHESTLREGEIDECADADIVVVTAGAKQKPGQTRMDLAAANSRMMEGLAPRIFAAAPSAVVLLVTNPVDVVTMVTRRIAVDRAFPSHRVLGSGTVLDSSRLRFLLAHRLDVAVSSVHASIAGEHGDSAIPLWSTASVQACPLHLYQPKGKRPITVRDRATIFEEVRNSAYEIIKGKGATNYAIGLTAARICRAILRDERAVLTVSSHHDRFGDAVSEPSCYSVPTVVGRVGVVRVIEETPLNEVERAGLANSARIVREQFDALSAR